MSGRIEKSSWFRLPWWFRLSRLFNLRESVPLSIRLGDFFSQFVLKFVGIGPGGRFNRGRLDGLMKFGYITTNAQKEKINGNLGTRIDSADIAVGSSRVERSVPVRVFHDPKSKSYKKTILFFHGGGFALGSPKMPHYHIFCSKLAMQGYVVLSIDYRLSPEHPFPAAIHDSFAVLEWLTELDAEEQLPNGANREHIVLVGDSAGELCGAVPVFSNLVGFERYKGGNLCAVLSSLVRDRLDTNLESCKLAVSIDAQFLVYPLLFAGKRFTQFHKMDGWMLPGEVLKWFVISYLGCTGEEVKQRMNDRRIAPLLAGVEKFPRTVIFIGGRDALYEGCVEMRSQLEVAGVSHLFVEYPREIHGFLDRNTKASAHSFQVITDELSKLDD